MKDYQAESIKAPLPDYPPVPHRITEPDWLDLLKTGDAEIRTTLPEWKDFQSFSKDLFGQPSGASNYILTVSPKGWRSLDHALNFLTPEQKQKLVWLWGARTESGDFEKVGEILFGDILLRIRPGGKAARNGLKKISVHTPGNKKNGYLLDFRSIADTPEQIIPALEECRELGIKLPKAGTLAAMSRTLLLVDCPEAFRKNGKTVVDAVGPPIMDIYRCALLVWRLGRFEAFFYGTIPFANVYDMKAAYPSKIGFLQYPGPPFTEWERWNRNYEKLGRDDLVYLFVYVEEFVPEGFVGVGSHRTYTLGGTRLSSPWGEGRRWIGLEQYKLRKALGMKVEILDGWLGFCKIPYHPMDRLASKMWKGRIKAPRLFKQLDVRMAGNFAATYPDIVDDGSQFGKLVRVPLETYCPIYAAAVVDSVLAEITALALSVPPGKLYGVSVDNIRTGIELATSATPGGLELKYSGMIRQFTDHIGDYRGETKWADRFTGDSLQVDRSPAGSLVTCFGRPGDLRKQQEMFDRGVTHSIVPVPVGPRKRFPTREIDFLKEHAVSKIPHSLELPELFLESWLEEDYMDIMDEEI